MKNNKIPCDDNMVSRIFNLIGKILEKCQFVFHTKQVAYQHLFSKGRKYDYRPYVLETIFTPSTKFVTTKALSFYNYKLQTYLQNSKCSPKNLMKTKGLYKTTSVLHSMILFTTCCTYTFGCK